MKIALFNEVSLARDMSELGLFQGDVATVVDHLPSTAASGGEEGSLLEVFNAVDESIAVRGRSVLPTSVPWSQFVTAQAVESLHLDQHQSRSIVLAKSDRHVTRFAFAFKL